MHTLLITQARVSSSRLPAKVLLPLGKGTVLSTHLERLRKSRLVDAFCVATTHEEGAEKIVEIAKECGWLSYQGSTQDVLDRYYQAAAGHHPEYVVRVTSDCPLIDPFYVDDLIEKFIAAKVDYASNGLLRPTLPNGMDCEIFSFSALERAWHNAKLESEREHVTPYLWKNTDVKGGTLFKGLSVEYQPDRSSIRLTLDQKEDYTLIQELVKRCGPAASMDDYLKEIDRDPALLKINEMHTRNAGYIKSLQNDKEVKQT